MIWITTILSFTEEEPLRSSSAWVFALAPCKGSTPPNCYDCKDSSLTRQAVKGLRDCRFARIAKVTVTEV